MKSCRAAHGVGYYRLHGECLGTLSLYWISGLGFFPCLTRPCLVYLMFIWCFFCYFSTIVSMVSKKATEQDWEV